MAAVVERTVVICNRRGLHARAAAKFVRLVEGQECPVTVVKDGNDVNGASIMGLLMLGAGMDSSITLRAEGPGAENIVAALCALIERRFDEE